MQPKQKYCIKIQLKEYPMAHKLSCPCCHIATEIYRYDRARSTTHDYLGCPECDYTFLAPDAPQEAPSLNEV